MKKEARNLIRIFSDELEQIIDRRNEKYSSRSEEWQDSEKGQEYQELTDNLQNLLDTTLETLNEFEN